MLKTAFSILTLLISCNAYSSTQALCDFWKEQQAHQLQVYKIHLKNLDNSYLSCEQAADSKACRKEHRDLYEVSHGELARATKARHEACDWL